MKNRITMQYPLRVMTTLQITLEIPDVDEGFSPEKSDDFEFLASDAQIVAVSELSTSSVSMTDAEEAAGEDEGFVGEVAKAIRAAFERGELNIG